MQSAADAILAREGVSLYAGDEERGASSSNRPVAVLGDDGFEQARTDGTILPVRATCRPDRRDAAAPRRCAVDHRRKTMTSIDPDDARRPYRDRIAVLPGDPPIAYRPGRVLVDEAALNELSGRGRSTPTGSVWNRSSSRRRRRQPDRRARGRRTPVGQWYGVDGPRMRRRSSRNMPRRGRATCSSTSSTSRTMPTVVAVRRIPRWPPRSPRTRGRRTRGGRIRGGRIRGGPEPDLAREPVAGQRRGTERPRHRQGADELGDARADAGAAAPTSPPARSTGERRGDRRARQRTGGRAGQRRGMIGRRCSAPH